MTTYLVTAAYADVIGDPQVYETEVDADSVPEAERAAQETCYRDNHGLTDEPVSPSDYMLVDVFARPAPIERDRFDIEGIRDALAGDSNDAEHDALVAVADALGITWVPFEEREDAEEAAKERATCSTCLARTYRGNEECVCDDEGDAEDYDEALSAELAERGYPQGTRREGASA